MTLGSHGAQDGDQIRRKVGGDTAAKADLGSATLSQILA